MFMIISLILFAFIRCLALEKVCEMSQLDRKLKPLTSLVSDGPWPQNEKEMDERICRAFPRYIRSTRNFLKNCAKGEVKAIFGVGIHAMERNSVKLFCKNNSGSNRRKFIASSKCRNNGISDASKCYIKMLSQVAAMGNSTGRQYLFPLLCCWGQSLGVIRRGRYSSLIRWKDCFVKTYEELGEPHCLTEHIEYMDQYLYKAMIDPMNIFCGDYDDSDKCNVFNEFLSVSSTDKVKYSTPFPYILKLLESL